MGPLNTTRNSNLSGAAYFDSSSDRYTQHSSRSSTGSSTYTSILKSSGLSPSTTSHGLPSHYSQASPITTTIPSFSHSYTFPTIASQYSQNDGRSLLDSNYTEQAALPDFSQVYCSTATSRRRSSDASISTFGSSHYPKRSRANTSFSAPYPSAQPTQEGTGHNLTQLPGAVQTTRPPWDYSYPFLQSEPGSFSQDFPLKFSSRQNSQVSEYPQEDVRPNPSQ